MQQTCHKCNRTFEINEREIQLYRSAKSRANVILNRNLNYLFKDDLESLQAQMENSSQARLIENSVPNPFICPYCGNNTEFQRKPGESSSSNSSGCGCWLIIVGLPIFLIGFIGMIYNGAPPSDTFAGVGAIVCIVGWVIWKGYLDQDE